MKIRWLYILVPVILFSCNNNADNHPTSNDTVQAVEAQSKELALIQNAFPQLLNYLKKEDASFDATHFFEAAESRLSPAPPQPLQEASLQPYKYLLVYNSDSSKAIDLYSYNYMITANDAENLQSAGPDTEVSLIDFKSKTRKRIFFSGPSFNIWDAAWLPQGNAVLAGAEIMDDQKKVPVFLQVNFSDSSIKSLQGTDTLQADMKEYMAQKIKKRV